MGHLSNPIGFRLSVEKKWNFTFFVKNIYYPELINTLINLRDYIYYYLTRKKLLQSGVSLSHFMLSKHLKNFYIKIYIYHIDLEKSAYDLMNKFYNMYYALYNEITHKYDKNKTEKQVKLYHYLRDLSNSDVYIYLLVFILFYKGKKKNNSNFLNNNLYNKNIKMKNYYNLIIFTFFKQFLNYYLKKKKNLICKKKLRVINLKMKLFYWMNKLKKINNLSKNWSIKNLNILEKNIKIAKIKGLILYKAKKLIKIKPLAYYMVQKCNYLKKCVLSTIQQHVIKLAWQITQKSIKNKIKQQQKYTKQVNIIKENQLLQNALQNFKVNYRKFFWVGKYKKYKFLRFNFKKFKRLSKTNKKLKKRILKLNKILFDKPWKRGLSTILNSSVKPTDLKTKVDPFTLFFFLSKKTGFKKVDNTYTLWKKWTVIFKYMHLFNEYDFLYKELFYYNINFFFYYMKIAIYRSTKMYKISKTRYGNFLNLRTLIFSCLQQGLYMTYFRSTLIWLNIFLKIGLSIIHNGGSLNKIDTDQLVLFFFFISNHNVTAPFLARYIVLKLKRGFTVVKTLNPLKRELIRVSKKSRNNPYSDYLTTYKSHQFFVYRKLKKSMLSFKKSCKIFYAYFLVKFYNNNSIITIPNWFSYILYFNKKIKRRELSFSKNWRSNILILLKNNLFNTIKYYIYIKLYKKISTKMQLKKIVKKYIKFFNFKNCIFSIKTKLLLFKFIKSKSENLTIRHGLWLFFISFFKHYEKKRKFFKSYKQELKQYILKSYKTYQKLNNRLYKMLLLNQNEMEALEAKNKIVIYNNTFFSIFNLCNNRILYKNKKKINIYKITFSSFFNRHYINYSMLKTIWNIFNNINLRNERDLYIPKYRSFIMGFKMVLKGRFSRKQRASKITLIKGKVPLNTFKMKVDYSFAHITLKNSEISLKFYLYKSLGYEIYKRYLAL